MYDDVETILNMLVCGYIDSSEALLYLMGLGFTEADIQEILDHEYATDSQRSDWQSAISEGKLSRMLRKEDLQYQGGGGSPALELLQGVLQDRGDIPESEDYLSYIRDAAIREAFHDTVGETPSFYRGEFQ